MEKQKLIRYLVEGDRFVVADISLPDVPNVNPSMFRYIGETLTVKRPLKEYSEKNSYICIAEGNGWTWGDYHMDIERTNLLLLKTQLFNSMLKQPSMPDL